MSELDLTSDEVKQAIADAVADATEGLRNKNTELLGKLKKAQQGQQIDPAELAAVESERDQLKADLAAANKAAKKATADLEAATRRASEIDAAYTGSLRDAALAESLAKAGVTDPVLQRAAKALLASGVEVVDDNGQRVVKAGDKALGDFITEWAGSDEGKRFVSAPDANGGGSHGGRGANHNPGDKLPDVSDKAGRVAALNARFANAEE